MRVNQQRATVDPAWVRLAPIHLIVEGLPQPKGSARAFVLPAKNGQPARAIVTSDNPKVKTWEKCVALAAKIQMSGQMFVGPVIVEMGFELHRPQALKGVDVWHTTRPDVDKLARAVIDALIGVCFQDDGQVVRIFAEKHYANVGAQTKVEMNVYPAPGEIQPAML